MAKADLTPEEIEARREKAREASRRSYRKNHEKNLARVKAWKEANAEHVKAYAGSDVAKASAKRSIAKNPEKYAAIAAKWECENKARRAELRAADLENKQAQSRARGARWMDKPGNREMKAVKMKAKKDQPEERERLRINKQNRRARVKASGGKLSPGLVTKLLDLQRGLCASCQCDIAERHELDHRMPLALGGAHEDANMELLCPPCNRLKNAKDPIEWAQSQGRLL